ncbi:DUF3558 domain-containing protein [Nocardia cyriacigeorgica]|jgi:hypothetical protein|uniref:DUF3558 domain-containing protein n=1 Tax=Nocardia cyriacigeorgica TaxID=135487 RepID=UPI0009D9FBB7|nr:DUF3558 domain-containing protein [Nocardia cyriacigeorgica]AVH20897.1 DUF3558 domain-containing protein [Nocardia cyriacigeorgica]MBF6325373.1 DUF3558 domain-containing protein [Nocardia cyriacigeorgica]PPJ08167.1 DUF3558 domain-containing protein [Nocardia cyriacigeorgica]TLF54655.1 DUF3558 domain-containing protein [Nocardia cyriacigeorgica]
MRQVFYVVLSTAVMGSLLSACANSPTSGTEEQSSTTPAPTLAAPVSSPPVQINNGGRRTVQYDPCTSLTDSVIVEIDFDPRTRRRGDSIFDTYSFLGCTFDRKEEVRGAMRATSTLDIDSSNITLNEFRDRESGKYTEISVGGRNAIRYENTAARSCHVIIESPDGTLSIAKSVNAAFTTERACDGIDTISAKLEASLPTS